MSMPSFTYDLSKRRTVELLNQNLQFLITILKLSKYKIHGTFIKIEKILVVPESIMPL